MKLPSKNLSRRHILQTLGSAALAYPLLRVLESEELIAAPSSKRAIFWYFPDGIIKPLFHPAETGSSFTLPIMTEPLSRVQSDLIMIKGVDYKTEGSHEGGGAYALTGMPQPKAGRSLDTVLGEFFQSSSQLPVVRLGVGANFQKNSSVSFFAPGIPAVVEDHPVKAFYSVFGATQTPIDPATREQIIRGEKSILDLSLMQLRTLDQRLAGNEKRKLDVHLEALRELERRVQDAGQVIGERLPVCTGQIDMRGLTFPERETQYPPMFHRNDLFPIIGDIMTDLAVEALACGVTRVVFFQWSHPVSPTIFDFPGGAGLSRGHHDISHYGGDAASSYARDFVACQRWFMERLARMIERLKAIPVGDKTLLYQTALLAFTEIADANLHDFTNVGLILAGQAGGSFRTGRTIDARGASHNQVLVSIQKAMGLASDDFGDPLAGRGPLPGLV